jgi:hypothetical protein
MCLLRNLFEMPLLSGGSAIKPGEWGALRTPFGHMVDQLQVQLLRLVCRLGSPSKVQGVVATFTAACSLMYAIRTRMCPMERAARMALISPLLDEVICKSLVPRHGCTCSRKKLFVERKDDGRSQSMVTDLGDGLSSVRSSSIPVLILFFTFRLLRGAGTFKKAAGYSGDLTLMTSLYFTHVLIRWVEECQSPKMLLSVLVSCQWKAQSTVRKFLYSHASSHPLKPPS